MRQFPRRGSYGEPRARILPWMSCSQSQLTEVALHITSTVSTGWSHGEWRLGATRVSSTTLPDASAAPLAPTSERAPLRTVAESPDRLVYRAGTVRRGLPRRGSGRAPSGPPGGGTRPGSGRLGRFRGTRTAGGSAGLGPAVSAVGYAWAPVWARACLGWARDGLARLSLGPIDKRAVRCAVFVVLWMARVPPTPGPLSGPAYLQVQGDRS